MLDTTTKRRIDTARDILVGKVPDPKSQVEQITIALIYKFMTDMDMESEELGGVRSYFTGDYDKYSWHKLFDPSLSGFEVLGLYGEALVKLSLNPSLPQLFRDIFKNAYLPYRDPETLKSFIKIINDFTYDHSEKLGDAFEYLLSVLGSQGDAGQFRTPRHIIDFMVELIDPKKTDTILDPACGTAGFLISSYKHIWKNNSSNYSPKEDKRAFEVQEAPIEELGALNGKNYNGDKLTPEERSRLIENICGYDISPDMVRLSLVNLYLHGFTEPHIYEYDSLTSDERWNEYYDIIMANPPFMSPKGGIRPHKRFSMESSRSEVLFVDYIAEHLKPTGRAAIIVPEGIIFQGGNAYKQLRKMLVEENFLVGVISLPAGVFNPYSGVKTSILWIDKSLARKTDSILFVKIANDGFDLGAQRKPIKMNDLPGAYELMASYRQYLEKGEVFQPPDDSNLMLVKREILATKGEYNLSGDRYRIDKANFNSQYTLIKLSEICNILGGGTPSKSNEEFWTNGTIKWLSAKHINILGRVVGYDLITPTALNVSASKIAPKGSTIIITRVSVGKLAFADDDYAINQDLTAIVSKDAGKLNEKYLYLCAKELAAKIDQNAVGIGVRGVTRDFVANLEIPLPPLPIQQEIVAEIESYQKIIDGARQVVENYKPRIDIDPEWGMVELGEVCKFKRGPFGGSLKKEIFVEDGYAVYEQSHAIYNQFNDIRYFIDDRKFKEMSGFRLEPGDLIMSCSGTMGKVAVVPDNIRPGIINQALLKLTPNKSMDVRFLKLWMESENFQISLNENTYGAAIKNVASVEVLKELKLSCPAKEIQQLIITSIEEEQQLVASNKRLIELYEQKIKDRIARVWGE